MEEKQTYSYYFLSSRLLHRIFLSPLKIFRVLEAILNIVGTGDFPMNVGFHLM
jgi:hypothetical protein